MSKVDRKRACSGVDLTPFRLLFGGFDESADIKTPSSLIFFNSQVPPSSRCPTARQCPLTRRRRYQDEIPIGPPEVRLPLRFVCGRHRIPSTVEDKAVASSAYPGPMQYWFGSVLQQRAVGVFASREHSARPLGCRVAKRGCARRDHL